jgi:hypothetical protein
MNIRTLILGLLLIFSGTHALADHRHHRHHRYYYQPPEPRVVCWWEHIPTGRYFIDHYGRRHDQFTVVRRCHQRW